MSKKKDKLIMVINIVGTVVCWLYIVAIMGIMPFYFTEGYARIGSDKADFFGKYGCLLLQIGFLVLLLYYLVKLIYFFTDKKKKNIVSWITEQFSISDYWVICYAFIAIISYLSTDYREAGWLGNAGWPMGLRTQLMVVLSYFLVSRFLVGNKYFFEIVIKVSGVVFALGILNHFDIWPLEMTHKNPSFLSTIGNTNWFCGYWSVVAWIAVARYWNRDYHSTKKEKWDTVFDLFMATVAMFTGIIQGSDSGMLTMAVIFVVLFWISLDNGDRMQRLLEVLFMLLAACCVGTVINGIFVKENIYPNALIDLMTRTICPWIGALIVGLLLFYVKKKNQMNCFRIVKAGLLKKIILTIGAIILVGYLLILVFNTMLPGRLPYFADKSAFIFNNEWGAQRGCTWKAAFLTWWNQDLWHKLIGVGPDGMWSFIVSGKVPELKAMVLEVFVGNRLLNGHGEWITNLANLGILGAVSYAGLMVTYIVRCMKKGSSMPLLYIFAITVLSYTVNNIFSFQTIVNLTHVFVMMGVGESLLRSEKSISN